MLKKNKDSTIISLGLVTAFISTIFSFVIIRLLLDIKDQTGKG
ncbi:hypothetical protein [Neobacillus drentensis]